MLDSTGRIFIDLKAGVGQSAGRPHYNCAYRAVQSKRADAQLHSGDCHPRLAPQ
jgi:hypothetical protein